MAYPPIREFRLLEYLGLGRVTNANMLKVRDMIVDICCEFLDMPYATRKFSTWQEVKLFYGTTKALAYSAYFNL